MRILLAYITVVLLWTTTPLAIKWSSEGPGFLFAATSRMSLGALCLLLTLIILRKPLIWHRKAILIYIAVAIQIYGSMMAVYWAAQFIPSGWISVLFGLAPLITALLAALVLGEKHLTASKIMAYGLGVYGLYILFGSALSLGTDAVYGVIGVLTSALLQSLSAVWIKKINAGLPALIQLAGGLGLALPLYWATWTITDGTLPEQLSLKNMQAILYLGAIATTIGFFLYYYLLTHLSAVQVALISLVTPVLALILGNLANHEPVTTQTLTGAGYILGALVLHELVSRLRLKPAFSASKTQSAQKKRRIGRYKQ